VPDRATGMNLPLAVGSGGMGRRNTLIVIVTALVVVVAAVVVVVRVNADDGPNWTTSDAPPPTVGTAPPTSFDKPAWRQPLTSPYSQAAVSDGYVAVREPNGVRVYDLPTGKERWHYLDSGRELTDVAVGNGRLTTVSDGEVRLFDLATGKGRAVVSVPTGDDRTAVPYRDGFLVLSNGNADDPYRMYTASGKQRWSHFPESCVGATRPYLGDDVLVIVSYCGPTLHVASLDKDANMLWRQKLADTTSPGLGTPVTPASLPKGAPLLLVSQGKVTPVDTATNTTLPSAPIPDNSELTSVPNGWCAYEQQQQPNPVVSCRDARTGAELTPPFVLPPTDDPDGATAEIVPGADGLTVISTYEGTVTIQGPGSGGTDIRTADPFPKTVYYGPGALVIKTGAELTVYS